MAVFPAIVPDHPATKEVRPREKRTPMGDGTEQVVRFGLNPMDTTWRLTWQRLSLDERGQIEDFLAARAADGEPFQWTPPDTATAQWFRVDQWEPARSTPTGWSLDLVFRKVFEVVGVVLSPVSADEDALIPDTLFVPCSTASIADGGFMWAARLNVPVLTAASNDPRSTSCISPDGETIYIAFWYFPAAEAGPGYLCVAKFNADGVNQWTARLTTQTPQRDRIAITASDNSVYVLCNSGTFTSMLSWRFAASNGAIVWQKSITDSGGLNGGAFGARFDTARSSLLVFARSNSPVTDAVLIEMAESNGDQVRRKKLTVAGATGGGVRPFGCIREPGGTYLFHGTRDTGNISWIARLSSNFASALQIRSLSLGGCDRAAVAPSGFVSLAAVNANASLLQLASDLSLVSCVNAGAVNVLGTVDMQADGSGRVFIAGGMSAVSYLSPAISGNMSTGVTAGGVTTYGPSLAERISGNASLCVLGAFPERRGTSSKSMHIPGNRFAASSSSQAPPNNLAAVFLLSHSIAYPADAGGGDVTLSVGSTPTERFARYLGDCSPTQPTSGAAVTVTPETWVWADATGGVSNSSFAVTDVTSTVTWVTYSRTLP